MNLLDEVERRTAPLPKAGKVRRLTQEEIRALEAECAITPVKQIPEVHMARRVSFPADYKMTRARYGRR